MKNHYSETDNLFPPDGIFRIDISYYKGNEIDDILVKIKNEIKTISQILGWEISEEFDDSITFLTPKMGTKSALKELFKPRFSTNIFKSQPLPNVSGDQITVYWNVVDNSKVFELKVFSSERGLTGLMNSFTLGIDRDQIKKRFNENAEKVFNLSVSKIKKIIVVKENIRQHENVNAIQEILEITKELNIKHELYDMITKNQSTIEKNLIPHFLKIFDLYEDQIKTYKTLWSNLNEIDFHKHDQNFVNNTLTSIPKYYSSIILLEMMIEDMIRFYLNNDSVSFYLIYNKFEELGLFLSTGQKNIISSLSQINENLINMSDKMNTLISMTSNIGESLCEKLDRISGKLTYSNTLSTINTFQLRSISKNTENLRRN
jgi:hypothetical protein